jgi:hypothetical protein
MQQLQLQEPIQAPINADVQRVIAWAVVNPATSSPPTPVPLAGYSAEVMVRVTAADPAPLIALTTTLGPAGGIILGYVPGSTAIDLDNGNIYVWWSNAAISACPIGLRTVLKCIWSLVVTDPYGIKTDLVTGPFWVLANPTYP